MEHMNNSIILRGNLREFPKFSHENHGKRFFRFTVDIPRLSGAMDTLPVIAEESVLNTLDPDGGQMLTITGQVRSHNLRIDGARRLMIFVFASTVIAEDGEPMNDVVLEGPLCKEPIYRRTPLGREICDLMLAIPRAFHRADYLPCIVWGRIAAEISACHTSDVICIHGRLQSRIYSKLTPDGLEERTAYEISALTAHVLSEDELQSRGQFSAPKATLPGVQQ